VGIAPFDAERPKRYQMLCEWVRAAEVGADVVDLFDGYVTGLGEMKRGRPFRAPVHKPGASGVVLPSPAFPSKWRKQGAEFVGG
jgi:hypothetical protein